MFYEYSSGPIEYSIVIPVFNQEDILVKNLTSIFAMTLGTYEILIILDYCYDDTEKNLLTFLQSYIPAPSLRSIRIFTNKEKPLFETKCDNIGFRNSRGTYCLEIQADMEMTQLGYNIELTKPFLRLPNVIAVSGRVASSLFERDGISQIAYGKVDEGVEKPIRELNIILGAFYVYETCNRGPLLLHRERLQELGYLDEEEYFLDNSDADLMARAYLQKGYICGYIPIDFHAPLCDGSTRKSSYKVCKEYLVNKLEKLRLARHCSAKPGLEKYRATWVNRDPVLYYV
jgi:glycosyltransferase involved in cell wall biosynthesis